MDIFTKQKRSDVMSKIRGKNTKPELLVFRYLRSEGIYFQKHYKRAAGSPDVALPRKKIAVFVDGDFWHGRTFKARRERLPEFWQKKIERNMKRDRKNRRILKKNGWKVLRIWESDLMKMKRREAYLSLIKSFLVPDA